MLAAIKRGKTYEPAKPDLEARKRSTDCWPALAIEKFWRMMSDTESRLQSNPVDEATAERIRNEAIDQFASELTDLELEVLISELTQVAEKLEER